MGSITPYLTFTDRGVEAMEFYKIVFGGDLVTQTFGESPVEAPPEAKDRLMHAHLNAPGLQLMASDCMPGQEAVIGTNVSLSIDCDSEEQQNAFFTALSEGGTVTMPLQDTFWGARFGMLVDRFGVSWMFNYDK
jgi:PhnB protein